MSNKAQEIIADYYNNLDESHRLGDIIWVEYISMDEFKKRYPSKKELEQLNKWEGDKE